MSKSVRKKAVRPVVSPAGKRPHAPAPRSRSVNRHSRTKLYWAMGSLIVVGLLAISFAADAGRTGSSSVNGRFAVGSRAPSFSGLDPLTGRWINSSSLAGKNILYYFSAGSSCQACMTQAQALQRDDRQLARDNIALVMVTNDSASGLVAAAHSYGLTLQMVADPTGAITSRFGAVGGGMDMGPNTADHSFMLVDRKGIVRFHQDFPTMWISTSALLHRFPMMT